jgi:hypothetical protein
VTSEPVSARSTHPSTALSARNCRCPCTTCAHVHLQHWTASWRTGPSSRAGWCRAQSGAQIAAAAGWWIPKCRARPARQLPEPTPAGDRGPTGRACSTETGPCSSNTRRKNVLPPSGTLSPTDATQSSNELRHLSSLADRPITADQTHHLGADMCGCTARTSAESDRRFRSADVVDRAACSPQLRSKPCRRPITGGKLRVPIVATRCSLWSGTAANCSASTSGGHRRSGWSTQTRDRAVRCSTP